MDSSAHACKHKDTCLRILGCNAYDIKERSTQVSCAVSARAIRSFTHFLFHEISSFLRRSRFLETIHHMFTFEEPQVISNFFGDRHTILEGGLSEWVVLHPLVPSAPSHASFFIIFEIFARSENYTSTCHCQRTLFQNSWFTRHTILEGGLSKWVVLHPLLTSVPSHTSLFLKYRHFWKHINVQFSENRLALQILSGGTINLHQISALAPALPGARNCDWLPLPRAIALGCLYLEDFFDLNRNSLHNKLHN